MKESNKTSNVGKDLVGRLLSKEEVDIISCANL
jgi:hypothetical protein